jgi:hypothetical protein
VLNFGVESRSGRPNPFSNEESQFYNQLGLLIPKTSKEETLALNAVPKPKAPHSLRVKTNKIPETATPVIVFFFPRFT